MFLYHRDCRRYILSIEGSIYAVLGDHIGKLESSLYNFAVGSIILAIALLFLGKGSLSYTVRAPKWELTGGLLGVVYLTVLVFAIPVIGVGLAMGSVVVGQMIMSAIIEHYGLLGSEKKPCASKNYRDYINDNRLNINILGGL